MKNLILSLIKNAAIILVIVLLLIFGLSYVNDKKNAKKLQIKTEKLSNTINNKIEKTQTNYNKFNKKIKKKQKVVDF